MSKPKVCRAVLFALKAVSCMQVAAGKQQPQQQKNRMFEDSKLTWLHHYTHQHTHSNGQGKSKHKLQAWQHHKICKRAALRGARRTESARAREGEIAAREIHTGRCKKSRHHLLRGGFLSRPGYAIRDHCRTFSSWRGAPKQRHTHTHTNGTGRFYAAVVAMN